MHTETEQVQNEAARLREENARLMCSVDELHRQLRTSEGQLRILCDVATDGYWDLDIRTNELNLSPGLKAMLGYRSEEIVPPGIGIRSLLMRDDYRRAIASWRLHRRFGQPINLDLRVLHRSGSTVWLNCRVVTTRDSSNRPIRVLGTHIDVTAQKEAEAALLASNLNLESRVTERTRALERERDRVLSLASTVPGVIYTFALRDDLTICFPYISDGCQDVFGVSANSLAKGVDIASSYIHEADRDRMLANLNRSYNEFQPWHEVYRYNHPDKGVVWLESTSIPTQCEQHVVLWHGFTRDVTHRKLHEDELFRLKQVADRRATLLSTARQVSMDILLSRPGPEAIRHILDTVKELVSADYAVVAIKDLELEEFVQIIGDRSLDATVTDADSMIVPRDMLSGIPFGSDRVEPVFDTHDIQRFRHLSFMPKVNVAFGIPIVRRGEILGTLFVGIADNKPPLHSAEEEAVTALADYVAVAIHYHRQLRHQQSLTRNFVNLLDEERRNIAFELHDGLTQFVISAHIFLDTYYDGLKDTDRHGDANLDRGIECLRLAVLESRRMVNDFSALKLDEMGLSGALEQLIDKEKEIAYWQDVSFAHNVAYRRFNQDLETSIYRITQEALSNVRKHSGSDRVSVTLIETPCDSGESYLRLSVRDWGRGLSEKDNEEQVGHLGMRSMRERTRMVDGIFNITSAPGAGVHISVTFELAC